MGKIALMSLADRIRAARNHAGLHLKPFADRVGVTYETARQWENGSITQLRGRSYDAICKLTGVNKAWLVSGAGAMVGDDPEQMSAAEIAAAIRNLPVHERMKLLAEVFRDLQQGGPEAPDK